jgi:LuxR family maltose regulon positive regulatory protein
MSLVSRQVAPEGRFGSESCSVYIRTKTRVPALSAAIVERPRLWKLLDGAGDAKLTLVQAPGGYGKTSVLQQWGARLGSSGAAVAWLSLDRTDREAEGFLGYLIHALDEAGVGVGPGVHATVAKGPIYSWKLLVTALANSFVGASRRCYLILDDVQHVRASPALDCLQHLIDTAPSELRFILATREDLGIPLGRLRATGQCAELLADELRFDSAEIAAYLTRCGHDAVTPDQIAMLEARTEGWIAGLKLISMALRLKPEGEVRAPIVTGEQRELADFFAEDVLAHQSPGLREFLLRTSVLDRLCPALCDSLPGLHGSRALLDECDAAGLFVVALDRARTWYRYHQLFADFLRRRLEDKEPGVADELCAAASAWFEEAGFFTEAFDYALRGNDPVRAAEIVDSQCESMWIQGRQETIQALAARLPAHIQARYPRIMLAMAWRLTAQWRVDEARQLVTASRARAAEIGRNGTAPAFARNLKARVLHRESQIAHYLYDLKTLETLCRAALDETDEVEDPYLAASLWLTLQYGLREQFRMDKVPGYIAKANLLMKRTGFTQGFVFHAAMVGPSYLLLGRAAEAIETLSSGLAIATKLTGPGSELGAVVAAHLAYAYYECDRLEKAKALIETYSAVPTVGIMDQLVSFYITRARLARFRGDDDAALDILDEALAFADSHNVPRLRGVCAAEKVRILLRLSQPDRATRAARRGNLTVSLEQSASHRRQTTLDSTMAQAWCRLAAVTGQLHNALSVARRWRLRVGAARAAYAAAQWSIVLAELLVLAGDRNAAQRALADALAEAADGNFVRMFVDAGEPVTELLEQLARRERAAPREFIDLVMAACGRPAGTSENATTSLAGCPTPVSGTLRTRELEILQLAGTGVPNKRIGSLLGLTEGTVKWYLQQVYNKLGVRGRNRAAAVARQPGLIGG